MNLVLSEHRDKPGFRWKEVEDDIPSRSHLAVGLAVLVLAAFLSVSLDSGSRRHWPVESLPQIDAADLNSAM